MTPQDEKRIREIIREELSKQQAYIFTRNLKINDGVNFELVGNKGTKIGTSATQKLSFYGLTPIVQPTAVSDSGAFSAGAGSAVDSLATWTSGVGSTAYRIGDIVRALKNLGIIAK